MNNILIFEEDETAHKLAEIKLKYYLGQLSESTGQVFLDAIKESTYKTYLRKIRHTDSHYSMHLEEAIDEYVTFLKETISDYKKIYNILLEENGVVILADNYLHIVNLKFDKEVPVSADNNPQLMLEALGAVDDLLAYYGFDTIRMTIHQPRLHNVSTYELPLSDLLKWW